MKKSPLFVGIVLSSLLAQGTYALTDDQKQSIETKLAREQVQESIVGLKRILKSTPKDRDARFYLAKAYFLNQDLESAQKELNRAKKLGIDQSLWMPLQAKLYLYEHKFEQIIEEFDLNKIKYKDPTAAWLLELKLITGEALLSLNKIDEAQEAFNSVLTHQPKSIEAGLGLVQSMLMLREADLAQKSLDETLKKSSKRSIKVDAKVQVIQAAIYRLKDDLESARISYLHALNLDEDNLQARLGLTELYLMQKNRENFIIQSHELYKRAPHHPLAMYYQALSLYSKNHTSDAINILEKLTQYNARHASSHLLLGYSYYKENRHEMAAKTLERYLQMKPNHPGAQAVLGAVMLKLNEPNKTIALLEPLVEQTPHFQWLALLGHAYVLKGDLDSGIETLQKASNMMPQDPAIKVELAASLIANNQDEQAQGVLDEVVENHDYVQADILSIFVALKNNKLDKAESIGEKLVMKQADNAIYQNVYGLALKAQGKYDKAETHFKNAIKKAPKFVAAMNNLAELYVVQDKLKEAQQVLDGILKDNPNSLRTLYLKSHIAEKQNNREEALKLLKTAEFRNPDKFDVVNQLVSFHLRGQDTQQAYTTAQQGLEKFPKHPQAKHLVGQLALHQKDYKKAFSVYNELNVEHPKNVQILQGLARSQLGLNLTEDARRSLETILIKQKNNLSALLLSADIALAQRDYSQLGDIAQQIKAAYPENPIADKLLGDATLGQGSVEKSVGYYKKAYQQAKSSHYAKSYYRALKYNKKGEEALKLLEAHLAENPHDSHTRQFLATEYLMNQDMAQAKKHYSLAIDHNPQDYVSYNNLAHVFMQEKNIKRAYELSKKAYEIAPHSIQVADTYAWSLIQMDQADKAVPILTTAIEQQPDAIQLRYHRAVGLYDSGLKLEAKRELEKIVNSEQSFDEKQQAKALLDQIERQG